RSVLLEAFVCASGARARFGGRGGGVRVAKWATRAGAAIVAVCATVGLAAAAPVPVSISTTLANTVITTGGSTHDSATLTGATSDAGGTVTYTVYTDSACTQNPFPRGTVSYTFYTDSACSLGTFPRGTVTVSNGVVPDSLPVTIIGGADAAGTYYWRAVYSGDAKNQGATTVCTDEPLHVVAATSIGT